MHIRAAEYQDRERIHHVYGAAFPEGERETVAKLAVDLLKETSRPRILSLVAEAEGHVVGHVAFSPVMIDSSAESLQGYLLAPLGVRPANQKQGVGAQLIRSGMRQLVEMGVDLLLVYGDPHYYGRFGFHADTAERYLPPYKLQFPFGWQGIRLNERGTERLPVAIDCVECLRNPALW